MTYSGQIRRPDAALDANREGRGSRALFWLVVGVAVLLLLAWRAGWFRDVVATGSAAVANPYGWV